LRNWDDWSGPSTEAGRQAYEDGLNAAAQGVQADDNPYVEGHLRTAWSRGYKQFHNRRSLRIRGF
jgi:hypothetical protein